MKRFLLFAAFLGVIAGSAEAYVLEGPVWPAGYLGIIMNLNATTYRLTNPRGFPLTDGSYTYQQVYYHAIEDWNQYILWVSLYPYQGNNPAGGTFGNGFNKIFFGSSAAGSKLDADTLGITIYYYINTGSTPAQVFTEADIVFNQTVRWNSYRGALYFRAMDIRRVMLHETGHLLGLDHPDIAGQAVNAIMNSSVSNTDDLTNDDVTGAQSLYGVRTPAPPPLPYNPFGI